MKVLLPALFSVVWGILQRRTGKHCDDHQVFIFRPVDSFYFVPKKKPGWLDVPYQNLNDPVPRPEKGISVRYLLALTFQHVLWDRTDDARAAFLQSLHTFDFKHKAALSSLFL